MWVCLRARLVGVSRESEDAVATGSTTAAQFFARFPELYSFLLAQLGEAAAATIASNSAATDAVDAASVDVKVAGESGDGGDVAAEDASALGLHPSLFPVLLLLSRMSAAYSASSGSGDVAMNIAAFVPILVDVAAIRHGKGRAMASRALAAIVPVDELASVLELVLSRIPTDAAVASRGGVVVSLNAVDGLLTHALRLVASLAIFVRGQLSVDDGPAGVIAPEAAGVGGAGVGGAGGAGGGAVLGTAAASPESLVAAAVTTIAAALAQRSWMFVPLPRGLLRCGFVREKVVRLLATVTLELPATPTRDGALQRALSSLPVDVRVLALQTLDRFDSVSASRYVDAGVALELESCAAVTVRATMFGGAWRDADAARALHDSLTHTSTAARSSAAISLKRALRQLCDGGESRGVQEREDGELTARCTPSRAALTASRCLTLSLRVCSCRAESFGRATAAALTRAVAGESNARCMRRQLQALLLLEQWLPGVVCDAAGVWPMLRGALSSTHDDRAKVPMLQLSGRAMTRVVSSLSSATEAEAAASLACVEEWLSIVQRACGCMHAWDVRLAAARALRHSGVVCTTAPLLQSLSCSAFMHCVGLLQDPDDEVRDAARLCIDDCVHAEPAVLAAALPSFVPAALCDDCALHVAYQVATSRFSSCDVYFRCVSAMWCAGTVSSVTAC